MRTKDELITKMAGALTQLESILAEIIEYSFPEEIDFPIEEDLERPVSQEKVAQPIDSAMDQVDNNDKCPQCGKPLKLRSGQYGDFWGCTGYPNCKYHKKA